MTLRICYYFINAYLFSLFYLHHIDISISKMLTNDSNLKLQNASPTFPVPPTEPVFPPVSTAAVQSKNVYRQGLTFGPAKKTEIPIPKLATPPFQITYSSPNGPVNPLPSPHPPGIIHYNNVNKHSPPTPIGSLIRGHFHSPVPAVTQTKTVTEKRQLIPIPITDIYNTNIIHEQPISDIWDNNYTKNGVKAPAVANGLCDCAQECCPNFNRLCKPCCPSCGCPWWVELLTVLSIIFGLYALFSVLKGVFTGSQCPNRNIAVPITQLASSSIPLPIIPTDSNRKEILTCNDGYFLYDGKCLSCPDESKWNGTHCTKVRYVNKTTTTITNSSGTFVLAAGSQPTKTHHLEQLENNSDVGNIEPDEKSSQQTQGYQLGQDKGEKKTDFDEGTKGQGTAGITSKHLFRNKA